jgi:glycosyltransferase involved in cell wall biosynthesis
MRLINRNCSLFKQRWGNETEVKAAANFPNLLGMTDRPFKKEGVLAMGTVALISPMKNHQEVLKALQQLSATIEWHIFGPVKDEAYWKSCELLIHAMPENIKVFYHGELPPHLLSKAMAQFQVFIMPSKSENFGHAIVEALSAGKPVITTTTTPFTDLESFNCGVALPLETLHEGLQRSITKFADMNEEEFRKSVVGTAHYIDQKIDKTSLKRAYRFLFESDTVEI